MSQATTIHELVDYSNGLNVSRTITPHLSPTLVNGGAFVFKTGLQQILLRKIFRLGWHFRFQSERCW